MRKSNSLGSTWKKLDLRVDTRMSIIQNHGENTGEEWEIFISDLEGPAPKSTAIGITDYIYVDGFIER